MKSDQHILFPEKARLALAKELSVAELEHCRFYEPSNVAIQKVLLLAANDTIAVSLSYLNRVLGDQGIHCIPTYINVYPLEKGSRGYQNNGVKAKPFRMWHLLKHRPDLLILGNDWDAYAKLVIWFCRRLNIPTVCVQESVIDLKDERSKRMQWADHVLCQGFNSAIQLQRKEVAVLANPRYEVQGFARSSSGTDVMVNCNFTYAVETNHRERWLADVVGSLNESSIPYFVSVHPRDTKEVKDAKEVLRSNATKIEEQLDRSSTLISRFSSLLHEALIQGKKVIYYNPHGEDPGFEFYKDKSSFILAHDKQELQRAIAEPRSKNGSKSLMLREFSYPMLRVETDVVGALKHLKGLKNRSGLKVNPFLALYRVFVWIIKKNIEGIHRHKVL